MQQLSNQALYIFFFALSIALLYLLAPILTPFLLGTLFAYLLNPLVKRLEKWHIPHLLSVIFIFLIFFSAATFIILMISPIVQKQVEMLVEVIPQIVFWLQNTALPWIQEAIDINTLKETLAANLPKAGMILSTVVTSGHTIITWIATLVLTPVVTFYLLRDWDRLRLKVTNILPKRIKSTVIKLAQECDEVLSAFFRGQLLVMLGLCVIYSVGLTLIGLKVGPIIGIIGGLLSIVPYLGSLFVLVASSIAAFVQFGDWHSLLWVLGVFLVGQGIEGYVLTPYLVGNRIGLHPVAVIFSIMAGGALFGFFGILVALPAAALIKVVGTFMLQRYQR